MNFRFNLVATVCLLAITYSTLSHAGKGSYDLVLSIDSAPNSVITVGDTASYDLRVENSGNARARQAVLTIALTPNVMPAAGLDSRCIVNSSSQVVCNLGNVSSGRSKFVSLGFDIDSEGSYQLAADVSARKSDADNSDNQAQHNFDAEPDSFVLYSWSEPNNVLTNITTRYANSSIGVGSHYGTLYPADSNGEGIGVIDGIISSYKINLGLQTIDVTRGIPGTALASGAQAIDAVSYRSFETIADASIIDKTTLVCLYDENNQAYMHPYSDLFPLQASKQATLDVTTFVAWTATAFSPKLATFYPGGIVDIGNVTHYYTATRDSLRVVDQDNVLVYYAVRSWNDRYLDVAPAHVNLTTGTGTIAEFQFAP